MDRKRKVLDRDPGRTPSPSMLADFHAVRESMYRGRFVAVCPGCQWCKPTTGRPIPEYVRFDGESA